MDFTSFSTSSRQSTGFTHDLELKMVRDFTELKKKDFQAQQKGYTQREKNASDKK
jgi:hypothetical protein